MSKFLLVFIFSLLFLSSNGQPTPHFMDSEGYDSLGREQGYWKLITALNFLKEGKVVEGIEGWEYGYFVDGLKTGTWVVKNDNGKLIGHRMYKNDTLFCEIQYGKNQKVTSIVRSKFKPATKNKDGINSYGEYIEIIVFNRKGRVVKRIYKSPDDKMITEEY